MGSRRERAGLWLYAAALVGGVWLLGKVAPSHTTPSETPDVFGYAEREDVEPETGRELSGIDLERVRGGRTYEDFDTERDANGSDSFEGFDCLDGCEGHSAGYDWARDNGITDPGECDGHSWSFIEGCAAYANQNREPDD